MSRSLFIRILDAVIDHDNYFEQRSDGLGRISLSTFQKTTMVFQMLAYGQLADASDEYIKIGKSTTIEYVVRYCRAVVEIFTELYLRSPTANDVAALFYIGQQWGFSRILGSLVCMQWKLKNYLIVQDVDSMNVMVKH